MSILNSLNVGLLFANIEHEVDELRRDVRVCELAKQNGKVKCTFVHDKCIVVPGSVLTKEGKGYTVRSHNPVPGRFSSCFDMLCRSIRPSYGPGYHTSLITRSYWPVRATSNPINQQYINMPTLVDSSTV